MFSALPFRFPAVCATNPRPSSIWTTKLRFAARLVYRSLKASCRDEVTMMPTRPKHPCAHPGCPELVSEGKYCDKHRTIHPEETRSASSRGYSRTWQRVSKQFLAAHPLCVQCLAEGRYVKATAVDHIVPHRGDGNLFWDRSNWQPLCKAHHDKKTGLEDSRPTYHYQR